MITDFPLASHFSRVHTGCSPKRMNSVM